MQGDKIISKTPSKSIILSYKSIIYKVNNNTQLASVLQIILQSQPNIHSLMRLHPHTHIPDLTPPLNPPQFLLLPHLIWHKLTFPLQFPTQSNTYLPVFMINMPNNIQSSNKPFKKPLQTKMKISMQIRKTDTDLVTSDQIILYQVFFKTRRSRQENIFLCNTL